VGELIGGATHCFNIRDSATGDTLLHHSTRTRNMALATVCLGPEAAVFIPIANNEGHTALHIAVERREQSLARVLTENLTPHLTDATAAMLTDALTKAALMMPEAVLSLLNDIEAMVLVEQGTVRTLYHRAEVIGFDTATPPAVDPDRKDDSETFESEQAGVLESVGGFDLTVWSSVLPSTDKQAMPTLVRFKTLMLPGLAGDPRDMSGGSAFHAIVANCDALVFESKLLQYVIQYKFETNVLPTLRREVLVYTLATLLASATTLTSSRQFEGGSGWEDKRLYIDVAQGVMVVAELLQLVAEARQMALLGVKGYFGSVWNLLDVGASIALVVGAAGHYQRSSDTVHLFGAIGVALKWFSATDYLRGFSSTGPIVRMIAVITHDVGPFLSVCSLVIAGCTFFLAINQPEADSAFGNFDGIGGILTPLLTVTLAALGSFEIGDYTKRAAVAMFLIFAFFVIILMLNLLIAIMGDAYTKVKESELVEGLHERAKLIVEHERLLARRQTYCRYLHVAEAVGESEAGGLTHAWEGLGGRIKALRRELQQDHEERQAQLEVVQTGVKADVAKLEASVADVKADVGNVKADVADVKELLERLIAQSAA
jgi:hypothetical protein